MYHKKYDALPMRYWILNQGNVDILNLDEGEEVLENSNVTNTYVPSEAQIDLSLDCEMVSEAIPGEYKNESICQKTFEVDAVQPDERQQLLLELPNDCSLILCFQCEDAAVKFNERISMAKEFQVTNYYK